VWDGCRRRWRARKPESTARAQRCVGPRRTASRAMPHGPRTQAQATQPRASVRAVQDGVRCLLRPVAAYTKAPTSLRGIEARRVCAVILCSPQPPSGASPVHQARVWSAHPIRQVSWLGDRPRATPSHPEPFPDSGLDAALVPPHSCGAAGVSHPLPSWPSMGPDRAVLLLGGHRRVNQP
jgi:hypothetical protein